MTIVNLKKTTTKEIKQEVVKLLILIIILTDTQMHSYLFMECCGAGCHDSHHPSNTVIVVQGTIDLLEVHMYKHMSWSEYQLVEMDSNLRVTASTWNNILSQELLPIPPTLKNRDPFPYSVATMKSREVR